MIKELREASRKDASEPLGIRAFRVFSIYLTALFVKLRFSPNLVSLLSIISAVGGAVLLMFGSYQFLIIGSAMMVFSYLLDRSDGELARYTGKLTIYGCYLEILNSNILYGSLFVGLSVGVYRYLGDITMLWFGISAVFFKFLYRFCNTSKGALLKNLNHKPEHAPLAINQTSPFYKKVLWEVFMFTFLANGIIILALVFAIINRLNFLLMFYGVAMPLVFLLQSYFHWLDLKNLQSENVGVPKK